MQAVSRWCLFGGVLTSAIVASQAQAVLIYNSGTTPTETRTIVSSSAGTYSDGVGSANIGDWVGQDGAFSGIAIGPNAFVTAKHFTTGATFILSGQTYTVTGQYTDPSAPNSDLLVATVDKTFSSYAPLYTTTDEVGKTGVIFGRGRAAGSLVTSTVSSSTVYNGYKYDDAPALDGQLSVGKGAINGITGTSAGSLLAWSFNPTAGSTSLTDGDSGGAVFLLKNGAWQLAGINYGITSPFSKSSDGSNPFGATIFNASGLYYNEGTASVPNWQPVSGPGFSEATRISTQSAWLAQFVPEPASLSILALGGIFALRRRSR